MNNAIAKKKTRRHRSEQFTELEKLQNEMTSRGWLLSKSMKDLLVEWFVDNRTKNSSEHSDEIFEAITELCTLYKHREPIVQFELSLWKIACFISPSNTMILDPVNYFFRGGWKKTKAASRHDPLIGIVITNVLPFLTSNDFITSCRRADYSGNTISSLIVSSAGSEDVNGMYINQHDKMYNDAPFFTKPGTYEGDAITYSIFKYGEEDSIWYISILPPTKDPGTSADIDFYASPPDFTGDYKQIPPTRDWKTCDGANHKGIHPPPLIIPVKGVA